MDAPDRVLIASKSHLHRTGRPHMFRVRGLQPPQEHFCRFHVVAVLIQRGNRLPLEGDVLCQTLSQAFGSLRPALESVRLHAEVIPRLWHDQ